jgi:hypothetical protein
MRERGTELELLSTDSLEPALEGFEQRAKPPNFPTKVVRVAVAR